MKVLFVDTNQTGHHFKYLSSLISIVDEYYVAVPDGNDINICLSNHLYNYKYRKRSFLTFISIIKRLRDVALVVKPDIIHFLNGDSLYFFFGLGLNHIYKEAKIIITCHHIRKSFLRNISYRNIYRVSDAVVVHTKNIKKNLAEIGLKNVYHIEYPQFGNSQIIDKNEALAKLGIVTRSKKTLLALGGTRKGKGLDILLEALKRVQEPFHLIIAGKEEDFKKDFILEHTITYTENVSLFLEFLTDEKFSLCLNAADIVVLPYRKVFDGASGPLGEGVWHYKMIVGPDHGSLGDIVKMNHLGKTFKSEDADVLSEVLNETIKMEWEPDEKYLEYRQSLDPAFFQKKYMKLYSDLTAK